MKVSTKWLNEYVPTIAEIEPTALSNKIELTAVEVDSVVRLQDGLKKIVVGHVLAMEMHPDSDHLHVCKVDVGESEPLQIVCGAPNIAVGQKVIVALKNSRIAGNIKIKKGKMRGVVSEGMICSLQEIGFADSVVPQKYADGIYVLPTDAVPGEPVYEYLGMDDTVLDLDLTPNRADLMSMRGVAHEVAAIYGKEVSFPAVDLHEDKEKAVDMITVASEDDLAPAYMMRIIKDVKVQESPMWLQKRLWNMGIRPINNVVDVTNYILMDYGQPLHAFDYEQLGSQQILVRRANEAEKFTTLDGKERTLHANDIVVTNGTKPIALAGVMGGLDSEVTATTATVALEAAVFNPHMIRKTSRREDLHTDAAVRFERGINVEVVAAALDAAAAMIAQLGQGRVLAGTVGQDHTDKQPTDVEISRQHINDVLGTELSDSEVGAIFERLGFTYQVTDGNFTVAVPKRRWDISIAADLVEEVARLYGYDQLPTTLPVSEATPGHYTYEQRMIRNANAVLEAAGLTQAVSYSLTSAEKAQRFTFDTGLTTQVQLPLNSERTTARMNLVSGLLDDLAYNVARKNNDVALYEQGRVFFRDEGQDRPREIEHIAGAMTGLFRANSWHAAKQPVDFYLAKGIVEHLLAKLGIKEDVVYQASQAYPEMHPGRTATISVAGELVGFVGEVHPNITKEYRLKKTYVFELDLDKIIAAPKSAEVYQPVPKYPAVTRDIALLVSEEVTNAMIIDTIKRNGGAYLESVNLFDVYQGENIKLGFKSMAYQLTYRSQTSTLVEDEVNQAFDKVVNSLQTELNATIR